ncbi:hypothetical protein HPB52_008145 [Rhipicephalus sanguineus]|uniref:Endonuclease/exonuclease/phosphatase domain-containing protein n=1 Tax=Rhipicephalus sanguineus TaxID=34632 RepID=A0A9D4PW96_RHISA|nr:hypothetical protein HPB52_008145 [Rhipicephalus sanguineus]
MNSTASRKRSRAEVSSDDEEDGHRKQSATSPADLASSDEESDPPQCTEEAGTEATIPANLDEAAAAVATSSAAQTTSASPPTALPSSGDTPVADTAAQDSGSPPPAPAAAERLTAPVDPLPAEAEDMDATDEATADTCMQNITRKTTPAMAAAFLSYQPPESQPDEVSFQEVKSKAALRRARRITTAALPVDPAVVGTVLFRPAAPGRSFRGTPRLSLAQALPSHPGVADIRVNHHRNIVAVDATCQECLTLLLALTKLRDIPVTAREPADCHTSMGFIHGVDGEPAEDTLLPGLQSAVPVLAATREGRTVTLCFGGLVPPERVALFRVRFPVRPARPRPLQCKQCGRYGHIREACRWPGSCIHCGRTHTADADCQRPRCVNSGGPHSADTPHCPRWQEQRQVATIMASSTTALSRRVAAAAVREETREARTYASAVKGHTLPARPVPAPRNSRKPPPIVTSLLLTLQGAEDELPGGSSLAAAHEPPWLVLLPGPTSTAARAFYSEIDGFFLHLQREGFDVLALQVYAQAEEVRLPGYVGYSSRTRCTLDTCHAAPCLDDCHPQGTARCAVYVKRELLQAEVPVADLVGGPFECCAVRVRLEGGDTTVTSVYIRPNQPWDPRCLRQLAHRLGKEFVLCGDVNAHHPAWGSHRTSPRGRALRDTLQQLGLQNLNTGVKTFLRGGGRAAQSAIDISAATEGCRYSWAPAPDTWGSDHLPLLLSPFRSLAPRDREYQVVDWRAYRRVRDLMQLVVDSARAATVVTKVSQGQRAPDIRHLALGAARRHARAVTAALTHIVKEKALPSKDMGIRNENIEEAAVSIPEDVIEELEAQREPPRKPPNSEGLHRAVRTILGLPGCSPVAATLAEAGEWPLTLRMLQRALGHIDRHHPLQERLRSMPGSRIGGLLPLYHQMVPDPPAPVASPPPRHRPAEVHLHLDGGRCASPACSRCGDPETLEDLLCARPGLAQERSRVTTAYRRQGLPASMLEHLLFPSRPHLPALRSLVEFLDETGIAAYR